MTDDDAIETIQCPACEMHFVPEDKAWRCEVCSERVCTNCIQVNEKLDRYECAACREGEALYRDTIGAIDFSRHGNG